MKGATATALLRPALEAAVEVARAGDRATPQEPAPASLRRYLSFAKLPDPALEVARRVLDDDEPFRRRVAAVAEEDLVGRAGWLFLHRPDGWAAELDRLLQEAAAAEIAAKDERHERGASRRLAGAEAALARAEAAARTSATAAQQARAELDTERLAGRALTDEVDRLRHDVELLTSERGELIRRLKGAEATANARTAELRAARHELHMAQAELAQALAGGVPVDLPAPAAQPEPAVVEVAGGLDPDEVAALVSGATDAADALRAALDALAALAGLAPDGSAPHADAAPAESASARARPPRRVPAALPPGVFDDGPEAAEHLVRVPGVLVLVDGYNISHARWHGLGPGEQRDRLLGACDELHARFGTDLEVVFDGSGEVETVAGGTRGAVRHRFTPAGVEADDVLLERVAEEPPARPVVVVSSDRRVRDGARRRGANVLGARQFLGTLQRADPG